MGDEFGGEDVVGAAVGGELTIFEDEDAVKEAVHEGEVVKDGEGGAALVDMVFHDVEEGDLMVHVEVGGGFVEEPEGRAGEDRPGHEGALEFAAA